MNRRGFLTLSAAAAALPVVAEAKPGLGRHTFSDRQFETLSAVAELVNPPDHPLPGASEVGVADKLDELAARFPEGMAKELKTAIALVQVRRLVHKDREGREALWTKLSQGSATDRQVHKSLTSLCTATYWASPEVWEHVGYPGPPL